MIETPSRTALATAILLLVSVLGEAQNATPTQEIGDLEFRTLAVCGQIPIPGCSKLARDYHDGLFQNFAGDDPADTTQFNIIEMLGEETPPCEDGPGPTTDSLYCFTNVPNSSYQGAYTIAYLTLTRAQRVAIITAAFQEETAAPAIGYIDDPFDEYIDLNPDVDTNNGTLVLDAVLEMRSDAFTEFAYASSGFPIVCNGACVSGGPNLTMINDTGYFITEAAGGLLTPVTQLANMQHSVIDPVIMTVFDPAGTINQGAKANTPYIGINVTEQYSGPGELLIYNGDPSLDGQLIAFQGTPWDATTHTYTSGDTGSDGYNIQVLGAAGTPIPNGHYFVTGVDQAGNNTSQSFTIYGNPLVDELGDFEFYQYFSGIGSATDAPSFLQTPSPTPLPFVVSAGCGPAEAGCNSIGGAPLQSIVITDPNGNNIIPIFSDDDDNMLNSQPSNTDLEDSTSSMTAYGSFTPTIPGPYTLTITNVDGGQTSTPFQLASIANQIDSTSTSGYDPDNGNFTWSLALDAQSNLGLDQMTQYNPLNGDLTDGPVLQTTQLNGAMTTQRTYSGALQDVSGANIETIDIDGNWAKYIIGFTSSTSLLPSDACCHSSFPKPGGTLGGAATLSNTLVPGATVLTVPTGGNGSFTTPVYDLFVSSVMPGALLRVGIWTDPLTQVISTYPAVVALI